jgi:CBS-domain-containing membrane protein
MRRTVADVMSGSVVAVRPAAGFKEIVTLMRQHNVSAVPVVDRPGHMIGIVSEADLMLKELPVEESPTASILATGRRGERARAAGVTASDVMTPGVVQIRNDAPVTEAAQLMHDQRVKRLPVVDRNGKLVGIVSRLDVLSVFDRPDEQIRSEIADGVIGGKFGFDPGAFDVEVSSGVVTVIGQVNRRDTAMRLLEAIRRSDGVVDVRDRMSYPREGQPDSAAARR